MPRIGDTPKLPSQSPEENKENRPAIEERIITLVKQALPKPTPDQLSRLTGDEQIQLIKRLPRHQTEIELFLHNLLQPAFPATTNSGSKRYDETTIVQTITDIPELNSYIKPCTVHITIKRPQGTVEVFNPQTKTVSFNQNFTIQVSFDLPEEEKTLIMKTIESLTKNNMQVAMTLQPLTEKVLVKGELKNLGLKGLILTPFLKLIGSREVEYQTLEGFSKSFNWKPSS